MSSRVGPREEMIRTRHRNRYDDEQINVQELREILQGEPVVHIGHGTYLKVAQRRCERVQQCDCRELYQGIERPVYHVRCQFSACSGPNSHVLETAEACHKSRTSLFDDLEHTMNIRGPACERSSHGSFSFRE